MPLFIFHSEQSAAQSRNLSLLTVRNVSTSARDLKEMAYILLFDLTYNALLGYSADHFGTPIT